MMGIRVKPRIPLVEKELESYYGNITLFLRDEKGTRDLALEKFRERMKGVDGKGRSCQTKEGKKTSECVSGKSICYIILQKWVKTGGYKSLLSTYYVSDGVLCTGSAVNTRDSNICHELMR
jgi:hypothetical protein